MGPYRVRGELAQGQLTTLSLARRRSPMGVMRSYVVKRLREPYASQSEYRELLHDEARLSAGLLHLNVVGVCDAGDANEPYVAMDYVEGESLENILARAGECHPRFIVPVLVDVLNGLFALHTAVNDVGAPLRLVHQAPSAHHVIVGSDGMARLCDFGQARPVLAPAAQRRSDKLRVAAMAPEQALDPARVDHRTDLFIVGLVLWEALTGERLFAAESEAATFHNLLHRKIPRPSTVGHRPPRCFDAIAMRALEREPAKRYASALEMARELREVGVEEGYYATTSDLGQWVRELYGPELEARRLLLEGHGDGVAASGLFSAPWAGEDPYRSGRIYGGSHSLVDVSNELERTPALGFRATQAPSPRGIDKPVRVREVDARRTPDERSFTPSGLRISEPPPVANKKDEVENTNPAGFVPARPGARRAPGQQSPGAYSEVKSRRKSTAPDAFDEVDTSRMEALPRRSSVPKVAEGRARSVTPVEVPRPRAIHEERGIIGGRRDSAPARLPLPLEPVGSPIQVPDPGPPTPFEQPPPVTLEELVLRRTLGDVIKLPDSLSPPDLAARTEAPPADGEGARQRGLGYWLCAGLVLGLIAVAGIVGVRDLGGRLAERPQAVQHAAATGLPEASSPQNAPRTGAPSRANVPAPSLGVEVGAPNFVEMDEAPARTLEPTHNVANVAPPDTLAARDAEPEATTEQGEGAASKTVLAPARIAPRPGALPARPGVKAPLKKPMAKPKFGPLSQVRAGGPAGRVERKAPASAQLPENPY